MQFIRSVLVQDEDIAAEEVKTYDLPINPLSHILLTLGFDNITDEAKLLQALERLEKIEVLYKGASVISLNGEDLWALDEILFKNAPILRTQVPDDSAKRCVGLIIPMGRKIMNPDECFPATKKGELVLRITFSSDETEVDGLNLQVETTELLGATPARHIKVTTLQKTPDATGEYDVALAVGNKYAGILLWNYTPGQKPGEVSSIDYIKTKLDGVEHDFSLTNWESLHAELLNKIGHREAYDLSLDHDDLTRIGLLDFDPYEGSDFLVDTAGKASWKLTINAGDVETIRILPIEIVAI